MTVALIATPSADVSAVWRELLEAQVGDLRCRIHPDTGDPADIEIALAWKAPHGALARFPNLKLICSLGMGADHLLEDPSLPPGVPITRLVDPNMIEQMSEYALYGVLYFHRHFPTYERFQRERRWEELPMADTARRRVGVLGIGAIGSECARRIAALGFPVRGWSRTARHIPGIECMHGSGQLAEFLANTDILVCVLPMTPQTCAIINRETLARLPRGAFFVNLARGGLVVEPDLVAALDAGQLDGALLDVTAIEPLPDTSPLWVHPKIKLTPHIAGLTNPPTAVATIVDNIRRLRAGLPLQHRVDRIAGY